MFLIRLCLAFVFLFNSAFNIAHGMERLGRGDINDAPFYRPIASSMRYIPRMVTSLAPPLVAPFVNDAVVPSIQPSQKPSFENINDTPKEDLCEKVDYGDVDSLFVQSLLYARQHPLNMDHTGRMYTASSQSFDQLPHSLKEGASPWFSPKDVNAYTVFEIHKGEDLSPNLFFLPYLTCLSVAQVLDEYGIQSSIRWPNDVMVNNKKISGIGINCDESIHIHMSVNVNMTEKDCQKIDQPATSFFMETGKILPVSQFLNHLLGTFFNNLDALKKNGGAEFRDAVSERLAYKKTHIVLTDGGIQQKGLLKGLDNNGCLILTKEDGRETTHCNGSVRPDPEKNPHPHDQDPQHNLLPPLIAGEEIARRSVNVWKKGPVVRGEIIEKQLGQNLHQNFPTVDKFKDGVVTSIKSLDVKAPTYQNTTKLRHTLTKYVDKVANFKGGAVNLENEILPSQIKSRALDLAIPRGASAAQKQIIQEAVEYGMTKNVAVNVIKIQ